MLQFHAASRILTRFAPEADDVDSVFSQLNRAFLQAWRPGRPGGENMFKNNEEKC